MIRHIGWRVLAVSCLLGSSAWGHPFHSGFAEVEWSEARQCLEVAVKVSAVDLETALSERFEQRIDLDDGEAVRPELKTYCGERFLVRCGADLEPGQLRWVGEELGLRDAWLYFEVHFEEPPAADAEWSFENRLLLDVQPTQEHTMQVGFTTQLWILSIDREHPRRALNEVQSRRRLPRR